MLPPRKPVLLLLFPFLLLVYLPAVWWWGLPYHLPHDPCKKRAFAPESPPKTEHPLLIVRIPSQTNPICGKRCPKHPVSKTSNQYVPPYATSQESPKERCLKPRTTVWEQDAGCSSHLAPTIKIAVELLNGLFYGVFYIGSRRGVWDKMCVFRGERWVKKRGAALCSFLWTRPMASGLQ